MIETTVRASGPRDVGIVSDADFEEWMRPRLMLFLSADVENSTRLKQSPQQGRIWLPPIIDFIHRFPTRYQAEREKFAIDHHYSIPERVVPWKLLGDEIIFAIEISQESQVGQEIVTFLSALRSWNSPTDGPETQSRGVVVKGTAWLAGFPVANTLIPVPSVSGELIRDYLGPSMDAGFRLTKWAASRRLIVSPELAWWLLQHTARSLELPKLHFQGCAELKGLAEHTGYPQLWMEVDKSPFRTLEDELLGRAALSQQEKLRELCSAFIEEFGTPRHLPFLETRRDPAQFPVERSDFAARLLEAREQMRKFLIVEETPFEGNIPQAQSKKASQALLKKIKTKTKRK